MKSKMKALEWSENFSQYMSMRTFPDTQSQLIPQYVVRSGRILNSLIIDCMAVVVTCRNEEDPMKMKALEW